MARKSVPPRRAWEDRYRTPTLPELLRGMDVPARDLFELMRGQLGSLPELRERLAWEGIPWRWSLSFRMPGLDQAFAYLVPHPGKPLLGVPLAAAELEAVLRTKMSKPFRDAVLLSPAVGNVRWTQWELASKTQIEELGVLLRAAYEGAVCHEAAHSG